ncbi:hypothetical protein TVAG_464200 [Trichomonas vaginalis G3]|uniref:Uncharacterized protein n=1 Tax=Trichomonas vaginalis (strain ATCC PRA-98 / G3) TaxID=412133 RepID=A2E272_TRIV3|nr:hypothetical protein TVAGG3_1048640 [Trichomonas vaginalis G3]EAY13286.1 hypothetical protein TVAG_464200 [Trichomonas vaginalis G3]KAI5494059.1 hypothetical protein TVAGG3_1048640 [Trichomonas vaginalis G3]|eukprot:XP_001325509.1 hypothetical protein [Trichomonas vaginalis G3]
MHFIYISYFNASKLLLDGSFFKFALEHEEELGHSTHIKLLRLMSSLPMNIPHINEIESKAFKFHRHFWFDSFKIFEYKIIKKHRCRSNDKEDLEYYARMSSAIQKYAELINSSVSVIQHEKKSNIFIYGSSLSYLARKLEFYVKLMLLRYPNKLNFVKLGALFYERCVMNPFIARNLCNCYNAISVYEFPNWRELTTQDVYFKTLFDETEYSNEKNDEDMSFDSNEQALNQSLKSAISNDMVKFEISNFSVVTVALHIIGFAFIFFVMCIIYSGTTLTQIYTGMLTLIDSLNMDLASFLKLLIFAFEPCLSQTSSSFNSSINLKNYLEEYSWNHQEFYRTLVTVLMSNRQLNSSLWSSFTTRYLISQTVNGDPFNYSYLTVGNRIITVVESMLFSDRCSDNLYYNYSQNFFLNLTDYVDNFDVLFQTSMGRVLSMIIRSTTLTGELGRAIVILSVFISLFSLLFYKMKFNKIQESTNDGNQTKESNLVTSMLSETNHETVYYISTVICTLTVIILLYVLNVYIMYYVAKQTSDTSSHNIQDIFRELKQTFYIGCAITGLRLQLINPDLRTKAKLNVEKAMRMISLTNRASSFNYSIIFNLSKLIGRSYFENTTQVTESFVLNTTYLFLTELMPSNLQLIEARKLKITINFNNISYYEVSLHSFIFLLSLILLSIVVSSLHHFIHSVLYSEMLTKLIPYIRTAVSEDGSNSVSGMNDNSFTLDLVGYPAAIVDSKDEIIFVNHLWLSAFNDVMSKFIGTNVNQYVTSAITGKEFDGLKVVVLEKSKEMDGLKKDVDEKKKEYKKVIKVLHPLESFTDEMKNRTAIVLSLNFVPLGEGDRSIEVDTCSFHSKNIISKLKGFVKPFNVRFLLWSFGELQLVFGLKDDDVKCAALNALSTAYYAIQVAIEGEEMFELSISALIMSGKFIDGNFDGRDVRQNRFPNAVLLSQSVADLVVDYVCDMAYIYNGYIMINVDDRDIDDTEMEEDTTEDIMYI